MEGIEAIDRSVPISHLIRVMQEVISWKGLIPTAFILLTHYYIMSKLGCCFKRDQLNSTFSKSCVAMNQHLMGRLTS